MDATRALFDKDRFAHHNSISLVELSPGYAKATMPVKPEHKNGFGTVHGGAYFTLADFTFAAACNSHGTLALAATAHISYLQAVSEGTLVAEAREVNIGRTLGTYSVEIRNGAGELVALFTGTAFRKGTPLAPQL